MLYKYLYIFVYILFVYSKFIWLNYFILFKFPIDIYLAYDFLRHNSDQYIKTRLLQPPCQSL